MHAVGLAILPALSFILPATMFGAPNTSSLFPSDTTWRFRRGTNEASVPATAWRQVDFNDATWEQGAAPFLYTSALTEPPFWNGGAFGGTLLNDMFSRYTTVYLRKSFVMTNTVHTISLTLTAASDDGFIAWLNGVEVARRNVTASSPAFNGLADSQVSEPQPVVDFVITNASSFREGTNILAIHALNALPNSSDFAFMASLSLTSDINPPQIMAIVPPANSEVEALSQVEITFNQSVGGVDAADLRVNGAVVASLTALSPARYRFEFPQPPTGTVSFAWVMTPGITNSAGDQFAGGSWNCVLNTNLPPSRPYISEFLADNRAGLRDEDGDSSDWIELFNPDTRPVALDGWFLTDSTNRLAKWRVPPVTLAPNTYLLVFASGKNRTNTSGRLHTSFRLSDDGGYLALVRPSGTSVASEFRYARQRKNVSYGIGLIPTIAERFFSPPTPGVANAAGYAGIVADTHFTTNRGFFFAPVDVTVWVPTPGATLVVTTNSSEPTLANGTVAQGTNITLRFAQTTVLRAAAFHEDWLPSDIDTHTYLFPATVGAQVAPAGAATSWPDPSGGVAADFRMDSRVTTNPLPGYGLTNSLLALPTLNVVTPNDGLFGMANGIYPQSLQDGPAWIRNASIELIYPDGREGFQHNVGFNLHGGASRYSTFTPKHGFNALFRTIFGSGDLDFPLFPDSRRRNFNRLVLRANSTDSWPVTEWLHQLVNGQPRWVRAEASYMRDQWVRDTQRAMGHPSAHGIYAQFYLNGLYWGLYNIIERPDDDFAAEYFGGDPEDYDVISDATDLHAGDWNAWNQLRFATGLDNDANYQRLMGNNADGTRNTNYPVLLDVTNLVDYMLLHIFIGADDWPDHNWWAVRDRSARSTGFKFMAWDQEISINSLIKQHTAWVLLRGGAPFYAEESTGNTPAEIYAHCRANAEFRQFFADRVQKHLFNDGALSISNNISRWVVLSNAIDCAVVAESARWGDFQRPAQPFRREVEWLRSNIWECSVYFPSNHFVALKRFRDANLFPTTVAPIFSQHGGLVTNGWPLVITNANGTGTIYFTTDGSDPRLRGGNVSPTAQVYSTPFAITSHTVVKARVRTGTVWSALTEAQFFVPQDYSAIQLTEIHYNPPAFEGTDGERFEFLELQNQGPIALRLDGLRFSFGVNYIFPRGSALAPGAFCLLVNNASHFGRLWANTPVLGEFSGKLDNGGEGLALTHQLGFTVFAMAYDDTGEWPGVADGPGPSLQRVNSATNLSDPVNWIASLPTPGAPFNPNTDTDFDGLPDVWEVNHGTDARVADADADPDGDGASNAEEFLAGTEPRDANSTLLISWIQSTGVGAVELRFTAVANRSYSIQWRRSADFGAWMKLSDVPAEPVNRTITVPHIAPLEATRFYRVVSPMVSP